MGQYWDMIFLAPLGFMVVLAIVYWIKEGFKLLRSRNSITTLSLNISKHWAQLSASARQARKADNLRKKEVKRHNEEIEIGETIFEVLRKEHELSGHSMDRSVGISYPYKDKPCCVWVGQRRHGSPIGTAYEPAVKITIDLRQPWERQITVVIGDHRQWPNRFGVCQHIKYLIDHFKIFQA